MPKYGEVFGRSDEPCHNDAYTHHTVQQRVDTANHNATLTDAPIANMGDVGAYICIALPIHHRLVHCQLGDGRYKVAEHILTPS